MLQNFFLSKNLKTSTFSGLSLLLFVVINRLCFSVTTDSAANTTLLITTSCYLGIILLTIGVTRKYWANRFGGIYWMLLAAAFISLLAQSLLLLIDTNLVAATTLKQLSYVALFLFYSFTIAAIEIHSYRNAKQLLSRQSLLIWLSSLTFSLAAFVLLVLAATPANQVLADKFDTLSIYTGLMTAYLMLRWLHLSWSQRKTQAWHFGLFAVATLNWTLVSWFSHQQTTTEPTTNYAIEWMNLFTYWLMFLAISRFRPESKTDSEDGSATQIHFFNSPLMSLIVSWLLPILILNNANWFVPLNSLQLQVAQVWLVLGLLLSVFQWLLFNQQLQRKNQQLDDATITGAVMQQRMLQQAQVLESQAAANRAILDTTDNAILTLDASHHILSCNPASCLLLGLSSEQLIGLDFMEITQAEGELARYFTYQSYQQKIASAPTGIEIESEVRNARGQPVPVHVTLSRQKNNSSGMLVVSLVNISEQKRAELEAHSLKDQFTANISHEFRTPLTLINGVLDNLLNQPQFESEKEALTTAKRNGMRMIRLVEQLLDLSRIANDPLPIDHFDGKPLIQFVCDSFVDIARHKQLSFEFEIPDQVILIGNQTALEKVLFNLLSNAFKYTQQGFVKLVVLREQQEFSLAISDSGIGMNAVEQTQVFERFRRIDNQATQTNQGVGIGLALVKELCDSMNWKIELNSIASQGSTFTLKIPGGAETLSPVQTNVKLQNFTSEAHNLSLEMIDARTPLLSSSQQKSKHSVLIVEDNNDMREHINKILSPFHQCLLANDGEQGFKLAIDYIPDIIISDIMMPGINGFELLKLIKTSDMTNHIPVILLTARGDSASLIRGLQGEADDYLSKPFNADELCLRVNNQLNSRLKLQLKLAAQWQKSPEQLTPPAEFEDKFIGKLESLFDAHFQNSDFTVQELANSLAMSDRQVQRKVKALFGMSPLDALKKFRLNKAKILLESNHQIGFVAQSCGFSSQSYFGRCFKEEFALTPKQFQQALH